MSNIAYVSGNIQLKDLQNGMTDQMMFDRIEEIAKDNNIEELFFDCEPPSSGEIHFSGVEDHWYEPSDYYKFFIQAASYIEYACFEFEYGEESGCYWQFEFKDGQLYEHNGQVVFTKSDTPLDLTKYQDPPDSPAR